MALTRSPLPSWPGCRSLKGTVVATDPVMHRATIDVVIATAPDRPAHIARLKIVDCVDPFARFAWLEIQEVDCRAGGCDTVRKVSFSNKSNLPSARLGAKGKVYTRLNPAASTHHGPTDQHLDGLFSHTMMRSKGCQIFARIRGVWLPMDSSQNPICNKDRTVVEPSYRTEAAQAWSTFGLVPFFSPQ